MPPLLMTLVLNRIRNTKKPFFVAPIARRMADTVLDGFVRPNIKRQLQFMEQELSGRAWFTGDAFSAADVMMSFPLEVAASRGGLDASAPKLNEWLARIHARPAYQAALKRGGPYSILR
jgi:glutathione S-transferase